MIPVHLSSLEADSFACADAVQSPGRGVLEYRDRLHPWCIVRRLPNLQNITVGRFRKRNDAEEHLKTLRRLIPADYVIAFEI